MVCLFNRSEIENFKIELASEMKKKKKKKREPKSFGSQKKKGNQKQPILTLYNIV